MKSKIKLALTALSIALLSAANTVQAAGHLVHSSENHGWYSTVNLANTGDKVVYYTLTITNCQNVLRCGTIAANVALGVGSSTTETVSAADSSKPFSFSYSVSVR